ncbi:MAG: ATP-binding protein [Kiritimatiellae bacterium]|nr:ATP-binding protein [Kiritimatiellia bacterium]
MGEATFPICDCESDRRALKVVALYGANASGKSNLLRAFHLFAEFVRSSAVGSLTDARVPVSPFLHVANWEGPPPPSRMEMLFVHGNFQYRYGFSATGVAVLEEWLYRKELARRYAREIELFVRYQDDGRDVIEPSAAFDRADQLIAEKTRRNALFLSTASMLAVPEAMEIVQNCFGRMAVFSADSDAMNVQTSKMIVDNRYRAQILSFLAQTDETIDHIEIEKKNVTDEFSSMMGRQVGEAFVLEPRVFLKNPEGHAYGQSIPLESIASRGTFKAFHLAGPMFETLGSGGVMMVDELDCRLHPILVRQIIRLFNSKTSNPKNAQLIFNTHDTNLLNDKVYDADKNRYENLLRRDQVCFVERGGDYASHIYSLIEFQKDGKAIRKDASFEKDYLNGLYGSIPYIGNFWEV